MAQTAPKPTAASSPSDGLVNAGRRRTGSVRSKQRIYLRALAAGNTRTASAALAGVSRTQPYRWAETSERFVVEIAQAEAEFQERCIRRIEQAAARGSWQADAWLLEHRWPEEFAPRSQVRLDLSDSRQAAIDHFERLEHMTLGEKLAELEELGAIIDADRPARPLLLEAHPIEPRTTRPPRPSWRLLRQTWRSRPPTKRRSLSGAVGRAARSGRGTAGRLRG